MVDRSASPSATLFHDLHPTRPPRFGRRTFLCGSGSLLGLAAFPDLRRLLPATREPLDFVKVGKEMLTRHGLDANATGTDVFYQVMTRACASIPLGPITLYLPKEGFQPNEGRSKTPPAAVASLQVAVPALLRALAQVGRWAGTPIHAALQSKALDALAKEFELRKDFDLAMLERPLPLTELVEKPDNQRVAAVLEALAALTPLPVLAPRAGREQPVPIPILVLSTRREMVEFLCLAGVAEPSLAGAFHVPAITGWMHSYYGSAAQQGRVQILCMQEGHVGDGALETWTEPSQDTDRELAAHTLTYDALVSLISGQAAALPNWFTLGLAFEGVMNQYGRIAGRLGADSVGDVTPPRQAFVPGGQSQGGQFPPNLSALRGTLGMKELRRFLEERKQAAFELLDERDPKDPQRKAALADDEVVYVNFRDTQNSEENGYLHFGPYLGQDMTLLLERQVSYDLALIQRSLFALAAAELAALEKGAALARLMTALPGAATPFEEVFEQATATTPTALERRFFAEIKKK